VGGKPARERFPEGPQNQEMFPSEIKIFNLELLYRGMSWDRWLTYSENTHRGFLIYTHTLYKYCKPFILLILLIMAYSLRKL